MKSFEDAIKNNSYEEAIEIFLDVADEHLQNNDYEIIYNYLSAFPKKILQDNPLLSYYYHISTHFTYPYVARKKLTELIPYFEEAHDYDRVAVIYYILLINYFFYGEGRKDYENLTKDAKRFAEKSEQISQLHRNKLELLIKLDPWLWYAKQDASKIFLEIEAGALETKNKEILILSRIASATHYLYRGHYSKALLQCKKAERIATLNEHKMSIAAIHGLKGSIYLFFGNSAEARKETDQGLELISDKSIFCNYLYVNLFNYYLQVDDFERAESIFEKIMYSDLERSTFFRLFMAYYGQMFSSHLSGDNEKALYYYTQIMKSEESKDFIDYGFKPPCFIFAEINLLAGKYDTAGSWLDIGMNLGLELESPDLIAKTHALLGILYSRQNDMEKSKYHFHQLEKLLITNKIEALFTQNKALLKEISEKAGLSNIQELIANQLQRMTQNHLDQADTAINKKHLIEHPVKIQALGALHIHAGGKDIPPERIERQKKLALLLKLLISNRNKRLPKEALFDIFWKDYDIKSARNNLNGLLFRIRNLIGGTHIFISSDTDHLYLIKGNYWLDVEEFEDNIKQGEVLLDQGDTQQALSLFKSAILLYNGDFLEDVLYDDQIIRERDRLKIKMIRTLYKSVKLYLDTGNYQHALNYAKKLTDIDPFCESGYRLLMMAGFLCGNRNELPKIYDKLCKSLHNGIGVEPDASTKELLDSLLRGALPSPSMWRKENLFS